ncbi:MAG: aminodeoxyfutalosine synthase, partial [Planctomycetota bacterium]
MSIPAILEPAFTIPPASAYSSASHTAAEARLHSQASAAGLGDIATKVIAGERLSYDEGMELYANPDLFAVGALANHVRERLHGDATYFNVNQHIN